MKKIGILIWEKHYRDVLKDIHKIFFKKIKYSKFAKFAYHYSSNSELKTLDPELFKSLFSNSCE